MSKPSNFLQAYRVRHGPKCQKHQLTKATFHVHGKMSRSKGQFAQILRRCYFDLVSQKTQTSKPIEHKFGVKQSERGKVLHAKFSHDRRTGKWVSKPPKVSNFIRIAVLASIVCCKVQDYVPIMLTFGTKQYTVFLPPASWPNV